MLWDWIIWVERGEDAEGQRGRMLGGLPQSPTPLVAPRCSVGQRPQLDPLRTQQNYPSAGSHLANSAT